MAPAKKKAKRARKAKKVKMMVTPAEKRSYNCMKKMNPNDVLCMYLDQLNQWFKEFNEDYTALRKAMCNVEREAFYADGLKGKRFCKGAGPGDPPSDPPPTPPTWE